MKRQRALERVRGFIEDRCGGLEAIEAVQAAKAEEERLAKEAKLEVRPHGKFTQLSNYPTHYFLPAISGTTDVGVAPLPLDHQMNAWSHAPYTPAAARVRSGAFISPLHPAAGACGNTRARDGRVLAQ